MSIYLGRIFDSGVLHFEYENCPACSSEKNIGGILRRRLYKYKYSEMIKYETVIHYIYNKQEDRIESGSITSDEIWFLHCSRWPDCKYVVPVSNSVLLEDPSMLVDAEHVYRKS